MSKFKIVKIRSIAFIIILKMKFDLKAISLMFASAFAFAENEN